MTVNYIVYTLNRTNEENEEKEVPIDSKRD